MNVIIRQRGGRDKWRHPRLKQATLFYAERLWGKGKVPNNVDIIIKIMSSIPQDRFGDIIAERKGGGWKATIRLQKGQPWSWCLEWLAHEMVHCWQSVTGKLKCTGFMRSWNGGEWIDRRDIPHHERYWEVEAKMIQESMRDAFFEVEDITGVY